MRGVKCSWKEMQRLHKEVLPAIESGDGKKYSEMRCVAPAAVSKWRRSSEVMDVIDESELTYVNFETFQPSHARTIAEHFRKKEKDWSEKTKGEILDWVERCESEEMTVATLKASLLATVAPEEPPSIPEGSRITSDLSELSGEKFGTIYADPPWKYGNQGTRAATDNHYGTMSVDDLCAMPVESLAADDAHLHLWTTNAFLPDSFRLIEAWGFEYRSCFVWVKPQMGIGNYWRVSHEFLLLGIRGNAKRFNNRSQMSWGQFDRTKHSAKPEQIRSAIELCSPGPYLELFGRNAIPGWVVYGNQINKQGSLLHATNAG